MASEPYSISRRDFLTHTVAATGLSVGAGSLVPVWGASQPSKRNSKDKIRMGFIGVGNRGTQLLTAFMANPDVQVTGLCDVYKPYRTRDRSQVSPRYLESGRIPALQEKFGPEVKQYSDFRRLLDAKDVDAVCIATPDHWHAVQAIQAIEAGKDVYVEKPLTKTIHEGRRMVQVQAASDRVVQVGLNRRGASVYRKLASVKSRKQPWCPLEEGHRSTSFAHLANIALATGTRIEWDPELERVTNHDRANELLSYEYRKPWSLG